MNAEHAPRILGLEGHEPGLRDYLAVLSRRRRAIVAFTLLVVLVAVGSGLVQTPRYSTEARVLIEPRVSEQQLDAVDQPLVVDRKRIIDTEVRIMGSREVHDRVEGVFGPDTPDAAVAAVEGTDLVSISVSSTDPALAAAVANETARQYIAFRTASTRADLADASASVQAQVDAATASIEELDDRIGTLTGAAQESARADREAAADQLRSSKAQLDALALKQSLATGNATVVDRADRPHDAVAPQPVRSGVLALFAGAILAVVLAFVIEFFDDRIDSRSTLEQVVPELPVLGLLPTISGWDDRASTHVATLEDRASSASEAYRSLRTALQFVAGNEDVHTIQVTSAMPGEGKTTTAVNLAVMFALAGQRTVLVDGDLRRPRVHSFLGLPNGNGFSTAVLKGRKLSSISHRVLEEHALVAIPAGPCPPYPAELLQSARSLELIEACKANSDVVIIDSAPVVPVTDAVVLSAHVDAVLLVVSADRSTKRNVRRAVDLLGHVAANVVGVALTEVSASEMGAYGTYVGYEADDRSRVQRFLRPGKVSP